MFVQISEYHHACLYSVGWRKLIVLLNLLFLPKLVHHSELHDYYNYDNDFIIFSDYMIFIIMFLEYL